jgi:hypothetical protein
MAKVARAASVAHQRVDKVVVALVVADPVAVTVVLVAVVLVAAVLVAAVLVAVRASRNRVTS